MNVDLDTVECRSAFELARQPRTTITVAAGKAPQHADLSAVELAEVLYLPHVLEPGQSLCLADGHFVPQESVLDCWSVGFFKRMREQQPAYRERYSDVLEPDRLNDTVCVLGNLFSRNFGHWTEELLKVVVLEHAGSECRYVIPALPSFALDFLTLIGVDRERVIVIDRPTVFARAIFTTAVSHETLSQHTAVLLLLRERIAERLPDVESGARLWLDRGVGLSNGGIVTNRDDVVRCLRPYDFTFIDLATLTVREQVQMVRGASLIAGVHGSQFVHAQFMPPGSTVIECFSPIHVNPSILDICRALGHGYHQIVSRTHLLSPYALGRDCEVDIDHLTLVLDSVSR